MKIYTKYQGAKVRIQQSGRCSTQGSHSRTTWSLTLNTTKIGYSEMNRLWNRQASVRYSFTMQWGFANVYLLANEAELSLFNWNEYQKYKANPEIKWWLSGNEWALDHIRIFKHIICFAPLLFIWSLFWLHFFCTLWKYLQNITIPKVKARHLTLLSIRTSKVPQITKYLVDESNIH